ncbi:hypothetical protein OG994_16635 [Micromonospora globbae]|uniref:Uncharacterized protein n=1 Tax=Micromonospora globbae TaxID=1894969 RepID=A0ABZ1S1I1_9ACTN|nr:hypothetical protein [Micromonospora globbae]
MRNASVLIDEVEYANQVTRARLVPDTPIQTLRTLVPDGAITDVDSTVWTLELSGVQSYKADGLAKFLTDNAGQKVEMVLTPKLGTGEDTATVTVTCVPVEFGGEQGAFRTFEVELPVEGQPVFGIAV